MTDNIIFYSHAKATPAGQVGTKFLEVHINGVTTKAAESFFEMLTFNIDSITLKALLEDICRFHDLGKYTVFFQNYLLKKGKADRELKKHSRFGSYAIFSKYTEEISSAFLAYFIIISHHSNLTDILKCVKKESINKEDYARQFATQKKSLHLYISYIEKEIGCVQLDNWLNVPEFKICRDHTRSLQNEKADIQNYFLVNYLFSLLIEADKLDASDTPVYYKQVIAINSVDKRLQNSTDSLRNQVRKTVIEKLVLPDILQHKIFTLTAPTGVGKTLTALDFALKLREKIYQHEKYLPQLIYCLPFINIIEQGLEEYQKTMPEVEVLAHYQYADVFAKEENDDEEINESDYNKRLMQLDTWQSDVVITSFVQFFQTLIGNRNKILKNFNHLAGAIVILDEVQTLGLEKIPLIGASLYYLSKFLGTRILLMTATKPKIFELAYREILQEKQQIDSLDDADKAFFNNGSPRYLELLHNNENVYESYRRTVIIPKLTKKLIDEEDFIESCFQELWCNTKSCIVVVNKVSRSIHLFEAVSSYLSESKFQNPVYCLSTNIVPCYRFEIIRQIKSDLLNKRFPVLISTQVVEAGVDLDFDMGFRDVGPIDSIVQVAGRINRHADPQHPMRESLPLYVVDFDDCKTIYGTITYAQSHIALSGKPEIKEADYLELVNNYFDAISNKGSFDYSRNLFQSMKTLKYDEEENAVSSFKIIEEQANTRSVFIEVDEEGVAAKAAFLDTLNFTSKEDFRQKKLIYDAKFKRAFNQRIITVPFYFTNDLEKIHPKVDNILLVDNQMIEDRYDFKTGYKRSKVAVPHTLML